EVLAEDEAAGIRAELPVELRTSLESTHDVELPREQLYEHTRRRLDVSPALARERVQLVCKVIGERLSADLVARLDKDLPAEVALLLHPRERDTLDVPEHAVARAPGHTLASGAAGSKHPLSEAHPAAHTHSVVREENPHAETKLSSTRGATQERLEESLATGKPGPERTIGTTRDSRR
ncbi:MAG: hypothetical protein K0S65_2609, partial [Labilithrix sp.]|nr:hypothetical protein [Labilithrix sp.]